MPASRESDLENRIPSGWERAAPAAGAVRRLRWSGRPVARLARHVHGTCLRFDGSDVDGLTEAEMPSLPQESYLQLYAETKAMGGT